MLTLRRVHGGWEKTDHEPEDESNASAGGRPIVCHDAEHRLKADDVFINRFLGTEYFCRID